MILSCMISCNSLHYTGAKNGVTGFCYSIPLRLFKSVLKQTSYTIRTSLITTVESHKDLGIILSNLTWHYAYDHVSCIPLINVVRSIINIYYTCMVGMCMCLSSFP